MSYLTPDVTDERDGLATFTQQQVHQVATALHGLTNEQLASTPSASAMSLGALARHLLLVGEQIVLAIQAAPDPAGTPQREPGQDQAEGNIAPEALRQDDDAEQLIDLLEELGRRAAHSIRAADLEVEVPIPDAPWFVEAERWNVRWCALHFMEEFARHAGHADIIRESIDGKGTYELHALADGEEWPPAGW